MLLLHCPYCEATREEQEFACLGEAFIDRPAEPEKLDDAQWADYLFARANPKGWIWEQWQHVSACRRIFVAHRHTATYEIRATYRLDEARTAFAAAREDA